MGVPKNEAGNRYGRLLVLDKFIVVGNRRRRKWDCLCDCGNACSVSGNDLRNGHTRSCGCLNHTGDANRTHGLTGTPIYLSWQDMKKRCYNENHKDYLRYGGRGISVCSRWLNSFENFLEDMGERPKWLTLDRINSDENYSKSNCRWATRLDQARNKTSIRAASGARGVFETKMGKFMAHIGVDYKLIHLGTYSDIESAAEARKQAELKYWK